LISLHLDIQANATLHVQRCCSQHDKGDYRLEEMTLNWVGTVRGIVAKFRFQR
jgi:hypothetical protein